MQNHPNYQILIVANALACVISHLFISVQNYLMIFICKELMTLKIQAFCRLVVLIKHPNAMKYNVCSILSDCDYGMKLGIAIFIIIVIIIIAIIIIIIFIRTYSTRKDHKNWRKCACTKIVQRIDRRISWITLRYSA